MSGSGSGSGSTGVNNSTRSIIMTSTENSNGGFVLGTNPTKATATDDCGSTPANRSVSNQGASRDDCVVMPLAAVHAAMSSATLDRHYQPSWRHHFGEHLQQSSKQTNPFGRAFLRNNSLGHAILPSQSQNTIPFAIDPKYDSDSDLDYRLRPPMYGTCLQEHKIVLKLISMIDIQCNVGTQLYRFVSFLQKTA